MDNGETSYGAIRNSDILQDNDYTRKSLTPKRFSIGVLFVCVATVIVFLGCSSNETISSALVNPTMLSETLVVYCTEFGVCMPYSPIAASPSDTYRAKYGADGAIKVYKKPDDGFCWNPPYTSACRDIVPGDVVWEYQTLTAPVPAKYDTPLLTWSPHKYQNLPEGETSMKAKIEVWGKSSQTLLNTIILSESYSISCGPITFTLDDNGVLQLVSESCPNTILLDSRSSGIVIQPDKYTPANTMKPTKKPKKNGKKGKKSKKAKKPKNKKKNKKKKNKKADISEGEERDYRAVEEEVEEKDLVVEEEEREEDEEEKEENGEESEGDEKDEEEEEEEEDEEEEEEEDEED
eukprot:CAMPEP_0182416054 /NCGR_PEP_ID=MMETSP1167-20130531/35_1 /TAXON_ID=2988 /ORGANISM="Mallomonas Sp, Strain CCMP3275" /LENGTH=348 /DNA_ID=CAMNT_0024588375 /DNA_START=235 /DNA_END=1278 /DNA_ORIENTATION=-